MSPKKYAIASVVASAPLIAVYYFSITHQEGFAGNLVAKQSHSQTSFTSNESISAVITPNTLGVLEGAKNAADDTANREKKSRPVPLLNLPLQQIFVELKDLSHSGNSAAACRLSYELSRCENFVRNQKKLEIGLSFMAGGKLLNSQQEKVKRNVEEAIAKDVPVCSGFLSGQNDKASDYLLLAARLGHPESMIEYVARGSPGLYESPPNAAELEIYQANVPAMLAAALATGIPEAFIFASSASVKDYYGVQLLPRDPIMSVAYQLAIARRATSDQRQRLETQGIKLCKNLA